MSEIKLSSVAAILLAAGKSQRMGQNKLLMPFEGETIIERTLDNLLDSCVGEIIVVLGSRAQEIGEVIGSRKVIMVLNPDFANGMSTSLITGMKMVSNQAQFILVALGDQPLIKPYTYNWLIQSAITSDKGILVPIFHGQRGNPIVLSSGYVSDILGLKGDVGGRELLQKYPEDVEEVAVNDEGVIININTMDEYEKRTAAINYGREEYLC
jgi:molybdenum cofactor cytidylyltransferase